MLYPDLRRLAIVRPTGMPLPHGTNNAEAGGSNDPLPPPPSRARPGEGDEAPATAQEEALASEDILHSILLALAEGDFADVCRAAARWCTLNKPHMAACDDGVWTQLTRTVFPNARAPNTGRDGRSDEPTRPKDWFFHLCTQHKQLRDLMEERLELAKKRVRTTSAASAEYARLAAKYALLMFKRKTLGSIVNGDNLPREILRWLYWNMRQLEIEIHGVASQMNPNPDRPYDPFAMLAHRRVDRVVNEEEERLLRAIALQQAYLRDINSDPELRGPPTPDDEIRRRSMHATKREQDRDLADQAAKAEVERKRQERRDEKEQFTAWLAALVQTDPREAALSRLIAEAETLMDHGLAEPSVRGITAKMKRTIARIAKARRARHTFANAPEVMTHLESELARDVELVNGPYWSEE